MLCSQIVIYWSVNDNDVEKLEKHLLKQAVFSAAALFCVRTQTCGTDRHEYAANQQVARVRMVWPVASMLVVLTSLSTCWHSPVFTNQAKQPASSQTCEVLQIIVCVMSTLTHVPSLDSGGCVQTSATST